jgi:hypothetical protein
LGDREAVSLDGHGASVGTRVADISRSSALVQDGVEADPFGACRFLGGPGLVRGGAPVRDTPVVLDRESGCCSLGFLSGRALRLTRSEGESLMVRAEGLR